MLYERWCRIASEKGNEIALRDVTTGRCWTFDQLRQSGENYPVSPGRMLFPQGNSPEFILMLLSAWEHGKMTCPLEAGQVIPDCETFPSGCIHFKLTSATTGTARMIAFTGPQLAADVDSIVATMGLRSEWPNLGVISLAHSYGFSNLVLPLLLHGIPLILLSSPLPEAVRRVISEGLPLTVAAVPALWRTWHEANVIRENVRLAISAGAPLSIRLEQDVFKTAGVKLHNFYGSSECGGIAYDRSNLPRTDDACAGTPLENVRLSIADNGCLVVQGAAVGQGYWPEGSPSLEQGVFRTNDLAELEGGIVLLRGRVTDQINVAGRKLSPETVERVLLSHSKVRECLVLGVPSRTAERSEDIVAIVVSDAVVTELKTFLLENLPAWQVPKEWLFLPSLPVTSRGKLSRHEWRVRWMNRNSTSISDVR